MGKEKVKNLSHFSENSYRAVRDPILSVVGFLWGQFMNCPHKSVNPELVYGLVQSLSKGAVHGELMKSRATSGRGHRAPTQSFQHPL